jgi:hypothetical protein
MAEPVIGIIGGSGLYEIDGLVDVEWRRVASPFGETSDEFCFGRLNGQAVVFVPRHGRGHKLPPSGINFRANIDALKRCGITDIVSLSAVGSLREDFAPGELWAGVRQPKGRPVGPHARRDARLQPALQAPTKKQRKPQRQASGREPERQLVLRLDEARRKCEA